MVNDMNFLTKKELLDLYKSGKKCYYRIGIDSRFTEPKKKKLIKCEKDFIKFINSWWIVVESITNTDYTLHGYSALDFELVGY